MACAGLTNKERAVTISIHIHTLTLTLTRPTFPCVPCSITHALQVSPSGDMVLDSGEDHSPERCAAFNIALSHFNIAVREAPQAAGAAADAQPAWNVSEGHRLTRFTDGMRIPSRGPLTTNRAAVLLAAYGR